MKVAPYRNSLHHLLVLGAARSRACAEPISPGAYCAALDQEAVAVLDVRELVAEPGLRRAPPRLLVLAVGAERRAATGCSRR